MELGDLFFNTNDRQKYPCPDYIIALLESLEEKLITQYWNKYQIQMSSPFRNTGADFKNDVFQVEAYSWDDDYAQPYNFKYQDIEISWYKYLGRGTTINKEITSEEAIKMFDNCTKSLDKL